ncbi:hypothetical protein [Fangia hongkongensis]|uniref:hypothetical protein n=1 Tax=Fangia hongkongensis TaxID=270495 RepID=UPI0012B66F1F|nr:hypothetical protein [Fangia hongkongensis]MBK2125130.1 hypothetical protein [Fangia hongkongensis]
MADRLIDRLGFIKISPQAIYLEGVFSDVQKQSLQARYQGAKFVDDLNGKVDLILSNACIHLAENIAGALERYQNALSKNALLLFSSFGSTTLQEITEAWRKSGDYVPHINQMLDMHDIGDILLKHQFKDPVVDSETLSLSYENLSTLFQDVREINEPLADTKMRKTLTGKNRWNAFCDALQEGGSVVSYEFIYGCAYTQAYLQAKRVDEEQASISLDMLKAWMKQNPQ